MSYSFGGLERDNFVCQYFNNLPGMSAQPSNMGGLCIYKCVLPELFNGLNRHVKLNSNMYKTSQNSTRLIWAMNEVERPIRSLGVFRSLSTGEVQTGY